MSTAKRRVFEREFKVSLVERLMAGESATALCREFRIDSSRLSEWWGHYRRHGPEGLRRAGRPRKTYAKVERVAEAVDLDSARQRVGDLERKISQQQVDLDFFREALRRIEGTRRPSDGLGVKASTPPSRR